MGPINFKRAAAKSTFERLGMHQKQSSIVDEARALENVASPGHESPEEHEEAVPGLEVLTPLSEEVGTVQKVMSRPPVFKNNPKFTVNHSKKAQSKRTPTPYVINEISTGKKGNLEKVRILDHPGQTPVAKTPRNATRAENCGKFLKVPPFIGGSNRVVPIRPTQRFDRDNSFVGDLSLLKGNSISKATFDTDDLKQLTETSFSNENFQVCNSVTPGVSMANAPLSGVRKAIVPSSVYTNTTTLKGDEFKSLEDDMKRTLSRGSDEVFERPSRDKLASLEKENLGRKRSFVGLLNKQKMSGISLSSVNEVNEN